MIRHPFDADLDQTSVLMTIQIRIQPLVLHLLENMKIFFVLSFTAVPVYIVLSFSSAYTAQYKKFSLALRLVEMDTDPNRQALLDADPAK